MDKALGPRMDRTNLQLWNSASAGTRGTSALLGACILVRKHFRQGITSVCFMRRLEDY